MKYFKSLWMKMRKSNGLPGGNILISMDKPIEAPVIKEIKVRKIRVKKEKPNDTTTNNT